MGHFKKGKLLRRNDITKNAIYFLFMLFIGGLTSCTMGGLEVKSHYSDKSLRSVCTNNPRTLPNPEDSKKTIVSRGLGKTGCSFWVFYDEDMRVRLILEVFQERDNWGQSGLFSGFLPKEWEYVILDYYDTNEARLNQWTLWRASVKNILQVVRNKEDILRKLGSPKEILLTLSGNITVQKGSKLTGLANEVLFYEIDKNDILLIFVDRASGNLNNAFRANISGPRYISNRVGYPVLDNP